ncbi:MAG: FecCD family ABC transporter permease [Armatimonadota bacterium]
MRGVKLLLLAVLLAASAVVSMGLGSTHISPMDVLRSLTGHAPEGLGVIIWELRLPRIAMALLVGASLAVAGALMQSFFHNPMADPYVVGASSGAALAAVAALSIGMQMSGVSMLAVIGGLASTYLVYTLSRRSGKLPTGLLLLTGIAVGGIMQALTAYLLLKSPGAEMRQVLSWLMGSLSTSNWSRVLTLLPYSVLGLVLATAWHRELNALALGEEAAHSLGVPLEKTKQLMLFTASLLASASVAVAGVVAFVGLIVPHLMRLLVGPNHRVLLPACVLGGGLVLIWADVLARTLVAGSELPIGVVTTVLGSVFFLYLLSRKP